MPIFLQSGQRLSYIRESGDERPIVRTQPQKSLSWYLSVNTGQFSQLPALWCPWLLLTAKPCGRGIVPPSGTAGTSRGSISGAPLAAFDTPSADC